MTETLADLTHRLLDAARKAGADAADALALSTAAVSVDMRDGRLEHAERSESADIGLRVFVGQRQASASASDTSDDTITLLAERAVAMARLAPEDPHTGLATPDVLAQNTDTAALDQLDTGPEPDPASLQDRAAQAETTARAHHGITQVDGTNAGCSLTHSHIAASNGFSHGTARSQHWLSCTAIAGTDGGMQRDHDGDVRLHLEDLRTPDDIASTAATRALSMLRARKAPTGRYPVLFDERVAASLIGHLLVASNGSSIARGASWLRDALGERILPTGLDLIEDPHRPRVADSRYCDAEGLPTAKRAIIDDGVLTGWTLDLATGRKLGLPSTANAARGMSGPPSPRAWNVALTQGTASRDDLLRDMGTGLLVTGFIGSTINPNTGDYSRGISGHWVENGQITYPVEECTIAGNLRNMLGRIVPANDARAHLSRVVPSLLVDGMTLAGS